MRIRQQGRDPSRFGGGDCGSSHRHSHGPRGMEGVAPITHPIRRKKGSPITPPGSGQCPEGSRAKSAVTTGRKELHTCSAWILPLASLKLSSRFKQRIFF